MASYYPPTNFFNNINFNNDFYAIPNNNQGISLAYANTHFLFSTGVATSTAITTLFSGSVGIGTIGGNAGTLNALTINAINSLQLNGNDLSNIYVSSNVILNYLSPYDLITDRQTAISTVNNNLTNNYYTKTSIDTSLNSKQNNLTFSSPLNNTANTVSINLSAYDLITDRQSAITTINNNLTNNYYNKTSIDTSLNSKQNNLTFSSPLNNTANTVTIDLSSKQNNLTFSSPLNNTANTVTINLSAYDLISDRQSAIDTCVKNANTNSGDIGLFSAVGGSFLNIVFNATHFKDVAVVGLINRQFNLNDTYANLPTTKNNKINWTSPLNYDTSTDTASIDLSSYSKTSINDTKYLKLDGMNTMALNSSITLTGTGKFSGDGSLLTNLPLGSYSTTTQMNSAISTALTPYSTTSINDGKYLLLSTGGTLPTGSITLTAGTFTGIHSGNGSGLTNLNYNNITVNPLTFTSPLSKSVGNVVSIDLSTYSTTTQMNSAISTALTPYSTTSINDGKYLKLDGTSSMALNSSITLTGTGTFTGKHSGDGSLLTNLPLNSYSTTGNDANYLKLSGGTMSGALLNTSTTTSEFKAIQMAHATRITHIPYLPNGNIYFRAPVIIDNSADYLSFGARTGDNLIRLYNNDFGFGINGGTLRYNVPMGSVHRFYHGTTNTAWIDDTGRIKATIFEGSGAALTNLPYSSITNFPDFLLKTGGTMTGGLILNHSNTNFWYNTPGTYFIDNGFTSFFNLNANVNTNFGLQTQPFITVYNRMWKNVGNTAIDIRTLGGANNAVNSDITIRIDSGGDPTIGANKGTILFSIDGANRHIINRSAFGIANINPIAGNLCIGTSVNSEGVSDGTLVISKNNAPSVGRSFKFGYDTDYNFCMGDCLGIGVYTWRPTDFTISYNLGNIGIGTVNQSHKLNVNGSTYFNGNSTINGTLNLLSTTSITPLFINSTATNSINNIELKNNTNNSCYIGIGGSGYNGNYVNNLFLQSPNSLILNSGGSGTASTPKMIINSSGNVGIGTTNPYSLLHIKGTNTALTIMSQGNAGAKSQLNLSTYDTTTYLPNCSLIATDMGSYAATFEIKQKTAGADANAQFTSLFIDTTGNVGIGITTNTTYKLYVNGTTYLNNNTTVNGSITTTTVSNSLISHFTATPYNNGSSPVNLASSVINLCCATTAGLGSTFNYLSVVCSDIANFIGTIVYLSSTGTFWTGYNFNARIIVDSSFTTNSGLPMGGSIFFQTSDTNNVSASTFKTICTINSRGLAIGSFTTNNYPLIVQGTTNATFSYVYVRTGYNGGGDFNSTSYNANVSAAFGGSIYVTTNLINSSDIRIKKEINDINDDGALRQILAIEPKTYKYIDYLSRGSSVVYGFIAQQIKEVIPHAVETLKDIIPNIYKPAICSSNIITLDNDVSQELNIGDNIKIYDELGDNDMYNITEINSNVIKIDKDINSSNVFVYGKEIEDFHTLKKDYIFTLNVCATQELYKLIEKQNEVIQNLQTQIDELKSRLN